MNVKECPSCAMEVEAKSKTCPICKYEFVNQSSPVRVIALLLALLFILYLIFQ